MRFVAAVLFLLASDVFLAASAVASDRVITAQVSSDLSSVTVSIPGDMGRLQAQDQSIWQRMENIQNGLRNRRFLTPESHLKTVSYTVNLRHNSTQWAIARWHHPLRISDWTNWLLTPVQWSMGQPFELHVSVPDGGRAVLPFQVLETRDGFARYRVTPVLPSHGGISLFGNVQVRQIELSGQRLFIVVTGDSTQRTEKMVEWAVNVATIAAIEHQAAPGQDALINLIPVPLVNSVVPWAHVKRGGGSHIIAYVQEDAAPEELMKDWTLFHEMTHLYHPYLHSGGRWVSEGFASYYQNLYRSTGGVVDPEYAWERLVAGWERGRKENESNGNRPVTEGGRMRTYWTAAALAYEADLRLREQGLSLAGIMGDFASRRMPVDRSWHPRDYLAALDDRVPDPVLVPLYDEYVRDRYFPEPAKSESLWRLIFEPK